MNKKSVLRYAFVALLAIVAGFALVVVLQPADFRVTRSAAIAAPPGVVFAQVNDLRQWEAWSPWTKLDPAARETFEGPRAGTGAVLRWAGNSEVGEGSMRITESRPNEFIQFRLEFLKPFEATSTAEFVFTPEGGQTVVSWTMFGRNSFMAKAVVLFLDCDAMVGGQFEKGLAQLKSVAETAAQFSPETGPHHARS